MTITIHIEAASAAELVTELQHLLQVHMLQAQVPPQPARPVVEMPGPVPETASQAATNGQGEAAPAAAVKTARARRAATVAEPEKLKLNRDDIRRALTAHMALNDEDSTTALLKKFGKVDKVSNLKEEDFQAVYDAAKAAS